MNAYWLFKKDLQTELKTRYAINSLAMFIIVAMSVILFAVGSEELSPRVTTGLLWIVSFFSVMSGLSRAFVAEEEKGTVLLLHLMASASTVFLGKLIYNIMLVFVINLFVTTLFLVFFDSFRIVCPALFFVSFILGNLGIAVSSTIIAAIIARAGNKGTLFPVLSFPVLLPLLITLIRLTSAASEGSGFSDSYIDILILICYDFVMFTASFLLFDFIWRE